MRTNFVRIPEGSFGTVFASLLLSFYCVSSVNFHCNFYSGNWPHIGNIYKCSPNVTNGDDVNLEAVTGEHLYGRNNTHVEGLYVVNVKLSFIPKNLPKFFPNLLGLRLYNTKMTTITANDLKPFPGLIDLSIQTNNLTSLASDLFQFSRKLKHVSFYRNSLTSIAEKDDSGKGLLRYSENITTANFLHNPCINMFANSSLQLQLLDNLIFQNCKPGINRNGVTSQTNHPHDFNKDRILLEVIKQNETIGRLLSIITKTAKKLEQLERQIKETRTDHYEPVSPIHFE